jgi:hypothetical protein
VDELEEQDHFADVKYIYRTTLTLDTSHARIGLLSSSASSSNVKVTGSGPDTTFSLYEVKTAVQLTIAAHTQIVCLPVDLRGYPDENSKIRLCDQLPPACSGLHRGSPIRRGADSHCQVLTLLKKYRSSTAVSGMRI